MSKLVIIDDDPIDHFLLQHIMQDNNTFKETTYAMHGGMVLDYIEENLAYPDKLPDVIFLDLNMPEFSGWDFLDGFQQLHSGLSKNIKIYILTSSVRPVDRTRSKQYPFVSSYINKPLDSDLINQIGPGTILLNQTGEALNIG
ncbi:MAG: response regulator transcription factor [Mucilaginibacter sp.]|nr:response regulator transcription factor [Mucilaginibacter sp.]